MNIIEDRLARASLTRLFEPRDAVGLALVAEHGARAALRIAIGARPAFVFPGVKEEDMATGLSRWQSRFADLNTENDLATVERLGGGFIIPGDEHWPTALDDLPDAPLGLWYVGNIEQGIPGPSAIVSLTGSRHCTAYGGSIAGEFAYGLAQKGICIASGLACGIDAHSHRGALAGNTDEGPGTIAVMAGGVDRIYSSGNADLGAAIQAHGLVLSEFPPTSAPTRARFLTRNWIIAALAGVTCVVEARHRSAALSAARQAETLGRKVAVVPGSIHSVICRLPPAGQGRNCGTGDRHGRALRGAGWLIYKLC